MAAISIATFNFDDVVKGDMIDISIDIEGIDLTGKTLLCQWRENYDKDVVVEFNETDGSLVKTIVSTTKTTVQFLKYSSSMDVIIGTYLHSIIMFTTDEDVQTLAKGTVSIVSQITIP